MHQNQHIKKLPNAPLKEVIFEVKWELDFDESSGRAFDSNFDIALGKFHNEIKEEFNGTVGRITALFTPRDLLNYVPQFQFYQKEKEFPLIQIGEGILTINDNDENYEWGQIFFPLIKDILNKLFTSYDNLITINSVTLRYIDIVDLSDNDYLEFLSKNLNYKVEKKFKLEGDLEAFNYREKINLKENDIVLTLNFSTGRNIDNNEVQLIWQYIATKEGRQTKEEVIEWADNAHTTTSNLFRNMLNSEFYESFKYRK